MNADTYARVHFVKIHNQKMFDSNDYYDVISILLANQLLNLIRYMVSGHHLTLKYIISIMKIRFAFLLQMFEYLSGPTTAFIDQIWMFSRPFFRVNFKFCIKFLITLFKCPKSAYKS